MQGLTHEKQTQIIDALLKLEETNPVSASEQYKSFFTPDIDPSVYGSLLEIGESLLKQKVENLKDDRSPEDADGMFRFLDKKVDEALKANNREPARHITFRTMEKQIFPIMNAYEAKGESGINGAHDFVNFLHSEKYDGAYVIDSAVRVAEAYETHRNDFGTSEEIFRMCDALIKTNGYSSFGSNGVHGRKGVNLYQTVYDNLQRLNDRKIVAPPAIDLFLQNFANSTPEKPDQPKPL